MLTVESTTATTILLSWTSAGSMVDSYEVMWERDTSGECPDEDRNSMSFSGSSTSHTIAGLEEDSNYTVIVRAVNAFGSEESNSVSGITAEAGTCRSKWATKNMLQYVIFICIIMGEEV